MRKLRNSELNRLSKDDFSTTPKNTVYVVLDEVRSLLNVGSIFRTADAFLVEEIILIGITATPPNKEIEKTALGATDTVKWRHFENQESAIDYLKGKGIAIVSIEQVVGSKQLDETRFPATPIAFVFGHEVKGVSEKIIGASEYCIEIPMLGTKHSFNVAVSAGIVLWHYLLTKG
jgi:23S rRNA (guanosine2251-2'-O)-methyltransferase